MPLNVAKLIQDRATASIGFAAGALEVEYYPARLTTEMVLDITDVERIDELTEERQRAMLTAPAQTILTLLAKWDFVETDPATGEERPMPLDEAHVKQLGIVIQWAILRGLIMNQQQAAAGEAPALEASKSA